MRRADPRHPWALTALAAITALSLVGAGSSKKRRETPPKVEETIGNLAYIQSKGELRLEGVGLVVGLDNTGSNPGPSWYRDQLVDEMRKAGVENPNKLLNSSNLSIVIVRLRVPHGTDTSDRLDAEVELPPGSGTKSLTGGYLLSTRLREILIAGGLPKQGSDLATAQGPVMIGTESLPDNPRVGRILGGGRVKKEMPFQIIIHENRRSFRTASLLQAAVNQRFHTRDGVNENGMAVAKTDQYLVLKVPRVYHHNQDRYFRIVKLLPIVDTPGLRSRRIAEWGKDLLDPGKAGIAALRLEGLGVTTIETLKAGLASPNAQVRFFAAEALAYLNDASGADVLAEAAVKQPEFRAYALAALAATDQSAAHTKLVKLMDVPEIEVRYGAFNALRTLDPHDPFLGQVRVLDEPAEPEEEGESLSLAIAGTARKRRSTREDPFALYVVDCDGPPLVHVARTRRREVVVFGRNQKLLPPVVLGTGDILLNAADGDEAIQLSKIVPSPYGDADQKVLASLELGDVLRQAANLGAKYPDVVTILQAASIQKNLCGPLVVDAVPGASPTYIDAAILGKDTTKKDSDVIRTKMEVTKKKNFFGRLFRWGSG